MHPLLQQLASGSLEGAFTETLESTWSKLQKHHLLDRTVNAERKRVEDRSLRYSKLQHFDSIRILELFPASSLSAPLKCNLKCSRIDEKKYSHEALSYVWGDTDNLVELNCDGGKIVPITRNLDTALRHLRCPDRSRMLWVDAVCINQSDIEERGHQVKLMRRIYKNATRVLIWIGEDIQFNNGHGSKSAAATAFQILDDIYYHMNVKYAMAARPTEARTIEARPGVKAPGIKFILSKRASPVTKGYKLIKNDETGRARPRFNRTWRAVEQFFMSPWFGRQWIVQEVVVAKEAVVIWGHEKIEWHRVGEVANWMKIDYPPRRRQLIAGAYNASYVYYLTMESKTANRFHPFLSVVVSAWNSQASDPRDKIYAMLGLPNSDSDPDKGELFLEPDYTLTTGEVYTAFARRVLEKERTLRLFSAVQHHPYASITTPSWVPQWRPSTTEPLVPIGSVTNRMPDYSLPDQSIFTVDQDLLTLRGRTLGRIIGDSVIIPPHQQAVNISSQYLENLMVSIENILAVQDMRLDLPRLKVLCWTLTVGRGNDLWASHVNHWDTFQVLWLEARKAFAAGDWRLIGQYGESMDEYGNEMLQPAIHNFLGSATHGRRVFVTSKGLIGLGPAALQPEDVVVVLFGGFTPFVLRKVEDYYLLVGECYVHGKMDGIEEWEDEGEVEEDEEFRLR